MASDEIDRESSLYAGATRLSFGSFRNRHSFGQSPQLDNKVMGIVDSNSSSARNSPLANPAKKDGGDCWQLCRHIFQRGLIEGIGSDVEVHVPAWGKVYRLHRLILDQNPYFSLLLQGGFREASADSVTLHFENNPYITAESFFFVLTQLYGGKQLYDDVITYNNVRQILATCSFFQLDHTCELCVDYILRSLNQENVVEYLVFADENRVQGSDRILDAVFTFLCREAYSSMDTQRVAQLPLTWIKKIIASDTFWVPSEYDRYQFTLRLMKARHHMYVRGHCSWRKRQSSAANVVEEEEQPVDVDEIVSTLDVHNNKRTSFAVSPDSTTEESLVYSDDVEDDLQTFDDILTHCIYYVHMTFEQLELISQDINPFIANSKQPLVPPHVLKDALWQQFQLRSKIEKAAEQDTVLGLTTTDRKHCTWQAIPADDMTTYTATSNCQRIYQDKTNSEQYSIYPPFRFSVEFKDFASLKHNIRVYSRTVFYAGSNWNLYIQKTKSQRKGALQLGVYLHRQSVPCIRRGEGSSSSDGDDGDSRQQCATTDDEPSSSSYYADKRKVVKTWFKIFCPTRGPRHALTVFQSSPDNFSVLQSWGWRSTTLCADEKLSSNPDIGRESLDEPLLRMSSRSSMTENEAHKKRQSSVVPSSSALRFCISMGHV